MDPLSLTVSVTALLTLCAQVGSLCTNYVSDVSDIDGTVATMRIEVSALSEVLTNIKSTLDSESFGNIRFEVLQATSDENHWKCVNGVLHGCEEALTDFKTVLE